MKEGIATQPWEESHSQAAARAIIPGPLSPSDLGAPSTGHTQLEAKFKGATDAPFRAEKSGERFHI